MRCGEYLISRPELYDILFNSIPRERTLLGKRVLSFTQNQKNVIIDYSDNSSYHGDLLVGADGAYSAVRQNLYKSLKDKKLPASVDISLPFSSICLVGQTVPLDPEEFPHMKEELGQIHTVLGDSTMCTMSPIGGVGGATAIHDAVTLANWLSTLRSSDEKEIENVFKKYRAERYPVAKAAFEASKMYNKNLGKRNDEAPPSALEEDFDQ
ncbi:hypothetical protein BG005_006686 [Podila minutissima]|nr:hypothetical protein BG005_006686 [Podila minutissima]